MNIEWIDLEKVWWAGYCENDYLGLLFPMRAWLFFSVALLVYGFAFESTFAKDKSPTIATLGAALVAGSLMWVVWRINWLLCLISFFILWTCWSAVDPYPPTALSYFLGKGWLVPLIDGVKTTSPAWTVLWVVHAFSVLLAWQKSSVVAT